MLPLGTCLFPLVKDQGTAALGRHEEWALGSSKLDKMVVFLLQQKTTSPSSVLVQMEQATDSYSYYPKTLF